MESLPGSVDVTDWQKAINWESAGAFRVRWLVICSTRFHAVGHLKNAYNEGQAVLIGKDGQEVERECAEGLLGIIDGEVERCLEGGRDSRKGFGDGQDGNVDDRRRFEDEIEWEWEGGEDEYYP